MYFQGLPMVPQCVIMLEFEGKHGTPECTGPQSRTIADMIDPVLTEANPSIQSGGGSMVTIILNIGTPGNRKRKTKSLSEMVLGGP